MDTTAYDRNLPCLNPNCKSHGKPHPNCKCYMAHGGDVGHFCAGDAPHQPECQYFKDGGAVKSFDELKDEGPPKAGVPKSFDAMKDEGPPKTAKPKKFDDIKDEGPPKFDELKDEGPPTAGQQVSDPWAKEKAIAEGFASGFVPFGREIEAGLGIATKEDIKKREEQFPYESGGAKVAGAITSYVTPAGPYKLLGQAVSKLPAVAALGAAGATAVANALQAEAQVTQDAISNYLMGQGPQNAGDAIAAWALDSATTVPVAVATGNLLPRGSAVAEKKLIENGEKLLVDLGKNPVTAKGIAQAMGIGVGGHAVKGLYEDVDNLMHGKETKFLEHGAEALGAGILNLVSRVTLNKPVSWANGKLAQAAAWALANNNAAAIPAVTRFASSIHNGIKLLTPAIDAAFRAGEAALVPAATEKQKEYFNKGVEDGGPYEGRTEEVQGFAKGGQVSASAQPDHVASLYPEAGILMGMARGRIYNYMNSLRPNQKTTKLPFDSDPPNKNRQRIYDRAREIAINPLSIMNGINKGNLSPDDMKHLTAMWPEVHSYISKQMTKKILEAQMKGEKPPYRKRQAMSLFLGASLDSTFTPTAIQAAQSIYLPKQQPPMPGKTSKSSLSKLAPSSLTNEQARIQRQQNQKA